MGMAGSAGSSNLFWTVATVTNSGSEAILVGSTGLSVVPEDGHEVRGDRWALSGNGQVAWVAMWNEFPTTPGDNWRFYAVPTDGSPALRSALSIDDLTYVNRLVTSDDGQLAWAMVDAGSATTFLRAAPGEAFGTVAELTRADGGGLDTFATTLPNYPCTTDDGSRLYALDGFDVWQVDEGFPEPFGVRDLTELIWDDDENRGVQYMDMDASGNRWLTYVDFYDSENGITRMMVTFEGLTEATIEHVEDDGRVLDPNISDDGETIAFTAETGEDPSRVLVGQSGGTFDVLTGFGELRRVAMSDDGTTLHVEDGPDGSDTYATFFCDVASGVRTRATSRAFTGAGPANVHLSDDGDVMAAAYSGQLWVMQRGLVENAGFPTLENIRFRYDENEDLMIRLTATDPDGEPSFGIQPLSGYLDWSLTVETASEDPFSAPEPRFVAIGDDPGTYEATYPLGGKRELIGSETTIRVWARNEARNRAVFVDFQVH
jgi:hypothetical protein